MWYLLPVIAQLDGRGSRLDVYDFTGSLVVSRNIFGSSQRRLGKAFTSLTEKTALSSTFAPGKVYSRHEGKKRIDQKMFIIIGGNKFLPPFDPLSNIIRTCFSFFFVFFFFSVIFFVFLFPLIWSYLSGLCGFYIRARLAVQRRP